MAHISLKKKVMAATVAMTMSLGTTVAVSPAANAQYYTRNNCGYQYCYFEDMYVYKQETQPYTKLRILIPGAWTQNVVSGGELADLRKDGEFMYIYPKPGAQGKITVDYSDSYGRTVRHVYCLDNSANAAQQTYQPTVINNYNVVFNFFGAGFGGQIPIPAGYRWKIGAGGQYVYYEEVNGQIVLTPKPEADGKNVIVVFEDGKGRQINQTVTINLNTGVEQVLQNNGTIEIEKRSTYKVIKGGELIDVTEQGTKIVVVAKPGAEGNAVIEVKDQAGNVFYYNITIVNTVQVDVQDATIKAGEYATILIPGNWSHRVTVGAEYVNVTREGNKLIIAGEKGANGTAVVEIVDGKGNVIGRYTIRVNTAVQTNEVRQQVTDRSDFKITRGESTNALKIISGAELVNRSEISEGWSLHTIQGKTGQLVVEENDHWGNLLTKYIIDIVPAEKPNADIYLKTTQNADLTGVNLVITKGAEYATLVKTGDGTWTLKPTGGKGTVTVENRDERGRIISTYTVYITEPVVTQVIPVELQNTGNFTINIQAGITYTVRQGSGLATVEEKNGQLVVTGKPGQTGKLIIDGKNKDGETVVTYEIDLTNPPVTPYIGEITNTGRLEITVTPGNTIKVIEGGNLITIRENGDKREIVPNQGATGKFIIEERDPNGNLVNRYEVTIKDAPQKGENDPKINKGAKDPIKNQDGSITVWIPGNPATITISHEYEWKRNSDGSFTIWRKDKQPVTGSLTINNVTINVKSDSTTGSSDKKLDDKCIGAIAATTLPLLLAIPLGILSQVQVPGFEAAHAQLNEAIREINNQVQRGLGIFNEDRAGAAARADNAAAQIAPVIGAVGTAIAAIAAIAGIGYGVLRACGVVEGSSDQPKTQ